MLFNSKEVDEVRVLDKLFIDKIEDNLKSQGIDISSLQIELVIREFLKEKRDILTSKAKVVEDGIGLSYSGSRLLRSGLSEKGYTAFLRYDLDEELKSELIDAYSNDI